MANLEEKLEHVAAGRAISFIPASAAPAIKLQPEVVARPMSDIPPIEIALAWKNATSLVAAFVQAARDIFAD